MSWTEEASSCVKWSTCQFKETAHLPLSKQFEAWKIQVKLESQVEESQHPVQTVTLTKITLRAKNQEIYPSLRNIESKLARISNLLTVHNNCIAFSWGTRVQALAHWPTSRPQKQYSHTSFTNQFTHTSQSILGTHTPPPNINTQSKGKCTY